MLEDTLQIAHADVDGRARHARRALEGTHGRRRRACSTARRRCPAAARRSSSAAAASGRRCGSWPSTPTPQRLRRARRRSATSTRSCAEHCDAVGRDYDEIEKIDAPGPSASRPTAAEPASSRRPSSSTASASLGRGRRPARHLQHAQRDRPRPARAHRPRRHPAAPRPDGSPDSPDPPGGYSGSVLRCRHERSSPRATAPSPPG